MFEDYLDVLKKYKSVVAVVAILVMAIGAFLVLQQKPEAKTADFPTVSTTTASQESTEKNTVMKSSSARPFSISPSRFVLSISFGFSSWDM